MANEKAVKMLKPSIERPAVMEALIHGSLALRLLQRNDGYTVLHFTALADKRDVATVLIEAGADLDAHTAAGPGWVDALRGSH